MDEAIEHCRAGASIWKWAGNDSTNDPDIVLACSGNEVTTEVIAAAQLLKKMLPILKTRVINVTDLMILETEGLHPHGLNQDMFDALFTKDKVTLLNHLHFNFLSLWYTTSMDTPLLFNSSFSTDLILIDSRFSDMMKKELLLLLSICWS